MHRLTMLCGPLHDGRSSVAVGPVLGRNRETRPRFLRPLPDGRGSAFGATTVRDWPVLWRKRETRPRLLRPLPDGRGSVAVGPVLWRNRETRPRFLRRLADGRGSAFGATAGLLLIFAASLAAQPPAPWTFAVSGDSRNCGDIVMPAIASGVISNGAEFYWHLGDYRAIYTFDEDMVPPAKLGLPAKPLTIISHQTGAWPDFIAHQLAPFGTLPVYLAVGNHETIPPASREQYLTQFADWLEAPVIQA